MEDSFTDTNAIDNWTNGHVPTCTVKNSDTVIAIEFFAKKHPQN